MATYSVRVPAATAVVGYDLFTEASAIVWARTPQGRTIRKVALVGSAALADSEIDLLIGEARIGNFFNTRAGVTTPNFDDWVMIGSLYVPPGALLRAVVRDAATTNPLHCAVELHDYRRR